MVCCNECFSSQYLKSIIVNNNTKGNCDFCKSKSVFTYDPKGFTNMFQGLLDLYAEHPDGEIIEEQIEIDFPNQIFSEKVKNNIQSLLSQIIRDDYNDYKELFSNKVLFNFLIDGDHKLALSDFHITWSKFEDEIKKMNRFHIQNTIDLGLLERLIKRYEVPIVKGEEFFRSRISDKEGYPIERMGAPPNDKAKSGRANPKGISYLYVADQVKTTLYETRASLLDYVTVGKFRLKEDINVVNLRGDTYDPMYLVDNDDLEDFVKHLPFIRKLEIELSKPNRKNDKELDYLPTQYISEFIKSIGYDGVLYNSSLFKEGYNLAIFNSDKFDCLGIEVHEIDNIEFGYKVIK